MGQIAVFSGPERRRRWSEEGKRCFQATAVHGMSSPTRLAGWRLASRVSMSVSQLCGLMP